MISLGSSPGNLRRVLNNEEPIYWYLAISLVSGNKLWWSNLEITQSNFEGGFVIEGGLGEIETGIDIIEGGNVDYIGALKIRLNNFADPQFVHKYIHPFNSDIWINRPVDIYVSAKNVSDVWENQLLYTGRIDHVDASLEEVVLDVMDWQERYELDLPKTLVTKEDYPSAPDESIGLPLPILYGNFIPTKESSLWDWDDMYEGTYAPTICIDKDQLAFCAAGHITHTMTTDRAYHRTNGMKCSAIIVCGANYPSTNSNDSGISTIRFSTGNIYADMRLHFGARGVYNDVSDYQNAIDGSNDTSATVAFGGENHLVMTMTGLPSGDMATDSLYIIFENIGTQNYAVGYILPGDSVMNNISVETESGGVVLTGMRGKSMAEISDYQFAIYCEGAGNADVTHFGLVVRYTISDTVYSSKHPLSFPLTGGVKIG
jgi:hypothetical protein